MAFGKRCSLVKHPVGIERKVDMFILSRVSYVVSHAAEFSRISIGG